MLIATDDIRTLTSPAGSAIVFSIQLSPAVDQFEDLTGRAFVFAVFDAVTEEEKAYWDGEVDTTARTITWTVHGNETRALYKLPTLKFQIVERRGGASFDPIAEGALTITQSAPRIASLDNASISRYIVRIVRFAPPGSIRAPRFTQTTELYNAAPIVAPTLGALTLSSTTFDEDAAQTITVAGATSGSIITASNLPAGLSISGRTITGTVANPGTYTIGLTETLVGANGSPRATSVTLTVRTVVVAPVLASLALSSTSYQVGVAVNATISGATAGSTLAASNLPAGLTLNSTARTISGTPTASGTASVTITETLSGATGSPKSSAFSITVAAAPSSFTMTQLGAPNRIYQRSTVTGGTQNKGVGAIPVTINVTAPGEVYARIRSHADGFTIFQAASALSPTTASGSQTVSVPVDARLDWFFVDLATSANGPWQLGTVKTGMGRLSLFSGQSQVSRAIGRTDGQTATNATLGVTISPNSSVLATYNDSRLLTTLNWSTPADNGPYDATFVSEFLRRQVDTHGVACGVISHSVGGTVISSWVPNTGNHNDLLRVVNAAGGFEAFFWHLGGTDAGQGTTGTAYKSALDQIVTSVTARNLVRGSAFEKYVTTTGTRLAGGAGNAATVTALRVAAIEWAASNAGVSIEHRDVTLADDVHQDPPGNIRYAYHADRATRNAHKGPAFNNATRVGKVITITTTMAVGGTALVLSGDPSSRFTILSNGAAHAVSSIAISGTSITVTLTNDPGDSTALDLFWLRHPDPSPTLAATNMIHDNYTADGIPIGRHLSPNHSSIIVPAISTGSSGSAKRVFKVGMAPAEVTLPTGYNKFSSAVPDSDLNANANRSIALFDMTGASSNLVMTISGFQGGNSTGTTTGNNSGVVPDVILQYFFYNGPSAGGVQNGGQTIPSSTVTVSGFVPGSSWRLRTTASRGVADRKVAFTAVGKATQTLEAGNNTSAIITLGDGPLVADSNGRISFTFAPIANVSTYGYLNYLELNEL